MSPLAIPTTALALAIEDLIRSLLRDLMPDYLSLLALMAVIRVFVLSKAEESFKRKAESWIASAWGLSRRVIRGLVRSGEPPATSCL